MKLTKENVAEVIKESQLLLEEDKSISPAVRGVMSLLMIFIVMMFDRLNLNSQNSSIPPASDPNRKKQGQSGRSNKKPGGQHGHIGKKLNKVTDPDEVKVIEWDRSALPKGNYTEAGYESRQVFDFKVLTHVTEYRAQVLKDSQGKRHVAPFPDHIKAATQYGPHVKASAVYMSQFQLLPYGRIRDYFSDQLGLPISQGTLFNFNKEAYRRLEKFEEMAKLKLINSRCIHVDETGVNLDGKRIWLHTACNQLWTQFSAHKRRGREGMDAAGILQEFKQVMVHDFWKPYYTYECQHALCHAHLQRELTWSAEEDGQTWAKQMKDLLSTTHQQVIKAGGMLGDLKQQQLQVSYQQILKEAQIECHCANRPPGQKKRGRIKQSKSRNLLERFMKHPSDILRFTRDRHVPFTNNQGENDLRMTKVQQKISGCFRSEEGVNIFCRVRGYLNTCRKHELNMLESLENIFKGELPEFKGPDPDPGE
jgi:transposase